MDAGCPVLERSRSFRLRHIDCEDGPYFEMELTPPRTSKGAPHTQDFEFRACVSASQGSENEPSFHAENTGVVNLSPADDLFYNGRLLPLYLPPRLHMISKLSFGKDIVLQLKHPQKTEEEEKSGMASAHFMDFDGGSHHEDLQATTLKPSSTSSSSPLFRFSFRNKFQKSASDAVTASGKCQKLLEKMRAMKVPLVLPLMIFRRSGLQKSAKTGTRAAANNTIHKYLKIVKHRISIRKEENELGDVQGAKSGRKNSSCSSGPSSPIHASVLSSIRREDNDVAIQGAIAHCKKCNGLSDAGFAESCRQ